MASRHEESNRKQSENGTEMGLAGLHNKEQGLEIRLSVRVEG